MGLAGGEEGGVAGARFGEGIREGVCNAAGGVGVNLEMDREFGREYGGGRGVRWGLEMRLIVWSCGGEKIRFMFGDIRPANSNLLDVSLAESSTANLGPWSSTPRWLQLGVAVVRDRDRQRGPHIWTSKSEMHIGERMFFGEHADS